MAEQAQILVVTPGEAGGQGRDRTADLAVFSRVLLIRARPGSSACVASALLSSADPAQVDDPGRIWMRSTRLKTARSAVRSCP